MLALRHTDQVHFVRGLGRGASGGAHAERTRWRNSLRVRGSVLKSPSMQDVTVVECGFCTPRIAMQRCTHSITCGRQRGST